MTGVWIGYDQPRTIIARGYAAILAVPLWARFMKAATSGDAPDEFPVPPTVSGVAICRISGQRASDGCYEVSSVAADGTVTHRSMVYTEYFVPGTEPVEICRGHQDSGFDSLLIETSGSGDLPAVASERTLPDLPPDEAVPLPAPPEGTAVPGVPVQTIPPPPPAPPADAVPPVDQTLRPPRHQ